MLGTPDKVDPNKLPGMGLGYGDDNSGGEAANCGSGNWVAKGPIFTELKVWEEVGEIMYSADSARRDKVILADLNGDGIDDYILADDDGTVRAWLNEGSLNEWMNLGTVHPESDEWSTITGDMIRFADVDNDGKADLIALYSDGAAKVWKNVDGGATYKSLDSKWATGLGESREKVHFQDIDGDGYADYVIIYDNGAVKWARNTGNNGQDDNEWNWEEAVEIAPGPAGMPANRAHLYDLDRDGMADYVIVYDGGAVKALRNTGHLNGDGPWPGYRNWDDLGIIAPGVKGVTGEMIRFADMDGDGLADLVAIAEDGSMRMWKNLGLIGTSKGSSIRFARLNKDKKVDIVSVDRQGRARAWLNEGLGKWKDIGEIAPGLNEDLTAAEIQFADVNGDGLDDFLVVHGSGAVKAYLNNGNLPDKTKRIWQDSQVISWGVGEPGRKITFADLNGDGYADYCIVFDGGAVSCYLNQQNIPPDEGDRIWGYRLTVATGVGWPGDKVRFADITGDGKEDYLIQFEGGGADGYNNTGNIPDAGRVRNWFGICTISTGVDPQGPVRYAYIDGDGKDDYLVVFGGGTVVAYINSCDWKLPDLGGGDGGGGGDDGLNYNSTCDDLLDETGNGNTYPSELWNKVGTQPYWKPWLSLGDGVTNNVVNEFAGEWGLTELGCNVGGNCEVPVSCAYKPRKGSARGHLVLRSIKNLHNYSRLREAIGESQDYFNSLQEVFQEYWPEDDLKDEDLANLLGTLEDAFGMAAAVSGSTSVGVANELFSAFSSTISEAMVNEGKTIEHASDLALFGFNFFNDSATAIDDLQNDLLREGHYEPSNGKKVILDDVFENGQWIDTSKIPIINDSNDSPRIDPQALRNFFFAWFHANILNYAWRNSMDYVIGYHMTESESYHWGYGYFLLRLGTRQSFGDTVYTRKEVPGYERIEDNDLNSGFTVEDVIKVSVDTFEEFGYNYTGSPVLDDYLNADWDTRRDVKPKVLGTFSLSVCDSSKIPRDDVFRRLKESIMDTNYDESPQYGSEVTCLCAELEDDEGQKFRDLFPYSYNFDLCPEYTKPPYT
ncbi:hypothetical protein QBC37DRAFT_475737 [Rhypophila decipiens]|uniref:Uncharacterized protein n=1 Tax=Rhypophila decipiens TaxID=261697 RepID=A0AAN6XYK9_9PEZI|nr:hypothetical protein QBC37DRAFT_475737 [Rhypophila decipiens]